MSKYRQVYIIVLSCELYHIILMYIMYNIMYYMRIPSPCKIHFAAWHSHFRTYNGMDVGTDISRIEPLASPGAGLFSKGFTIKCKTRFKIQ